MKVRMIEQRDNGVCLFELKNDEIKVITSNLGCHVLSVFTKVTWERSPDVLQIVSEMQSLN